MSRRVFVAAGLLAIASCGGGNMPSPSPSPTAAPPPAPVVQAPPKAVERATITVKSTGFVLDQTTAAFFSLSDLHIYQGGTLTFVNDDFQPHDIMSDPFHIHTDCPAINVVGFLVPGQSRSTEALTQVRSCGFHDHDHEGNPAYHGTAVVEPR